MLTSIHLQNFKGFKDTKIEPLRKVNLVVGGQNVGKTSLLEGIYGSVNQGGLMNFNNYTAIAQSRFRRYAGNRLFNWTALGGANNMSKLFVQSSCELGQNTMSLNPSTFPVYPIEDTELVQLYNIAVRNEKKLQWIQLLQKIEPRLDSLESIAAEGEGVPSVHAGVRLHELAPLSALGQGFNRLAYLYAGLLGNNSKLALIDEIENGIHYSSLPTVFEGIKNIAQSNDVQSIITTHSLEAIRAASHVFKDSPDDFQVIRLVRTDDNIEADIIPAQYVEAAVKHGGEIR